MNPSLWGPSLWSSLIYIVLNYPEKDPNPTESQAFRDYFEKLGAVLPCNICRNHYQKDFPVNPPKLENRQALFEWLLELHNRCNPKNKFNREQFLKRYAPKCQGLIHNSKTVKNKQSNKKILDNRRKLRKAVHQKR